MTIDVGQWEIVQANQNHMFSVVLQTPKDHSFQISHKIFYDNIFGHFKCKRTCKNQHTCEVSKTDTGSVSQVHYLAKQSRTFQIATPFNFKHRI